MKKQLLIAALIGITVTAFAGDFVIYPVSISTNNLPVSGCSGAFVGSAVYAKMGTNYGWLVDTNAVMHYAEDTNHYGMTAVKATGKGGNNSCGYGLVTPVVDANNMKFRFVQAYTNLSQMPHTTNDAPLVLSGFNP